MKKLLCTLVILAVVLGLTGCDTEGIQELRDTITGAKTQLTRFDEVVAELENDIVRQEIILVDLPEGPEKEEKAELVHNLRGLVKKYKAGSLALTEKITKFESELATAEDEIDVFESVGRTVAPFAGGYAPLVVLSVGLIGSIWRGIRKAKQAEAGVSVIRAIETVKVDGVVNFSAGATTKNLSELMGAAGKALVDKVQKEFK